MSDSYLRATKIAGQLLIGAQLDAIHVYSVVLMLSFNRLGMEAPNQVWITASANMSLSDDATCNQGLHFGNFADGRAMFIAKAYALLGSTVTQVAIEEGGELIVGFGNSSVKVAPAGDDLEESWGISDTSVMAPSSKWYVGRDDRGDITVRHP